MYRIKVNSKKVFENGERLDEVKTIFSKRTIRNFPQDITIEAFSSKISNENVIQKREIANDAKFE